MLPGFLHFDLTRGLTAPMVNAALAHLIGSDEAIIRALSLLNLGEVCCKLNHYNNHVQGRIMSFFIGEKALDSYDESFQNIKNPFIKECLENEYIELDALFKPFHHKALDVRISALALTIMENLRGTGSAEQRVPRNQSLWIFCHTLAFSAQLRELDPKFITSTPIFKGAMNEGEKSFVHDSYRIEDVLLGLPLCEIGDARLLDALAIAFIKSVTSSFGARGAMTMLKHGVGFKDDAKDAMVQASWCEANLPDTIAEVGLRNAPKHNFMSEVSGLVLASSDVVELVSMLSLARAMSISYHLVQGERNNNFYSVRFLIRHEDKREALEAFLVKACAMQVVEKSVECHELKKRVATVSLGHGNKATIVRFFEYLYYDKCVRVEPFKEDLEAYSKKTDHSIEVARADMLMAWKKWRGCMVEDSFQPTSS